MKYRDISKLIEDSSDETDSDFDKRWDQEFPDRGAKLVTVDGLFDEMKRIMEFK